MIRIRIAATEDREEVCEDLDRNNVDNRLRCCGIGDAWCRETNCCGRCGATHRGRRAERWRHISPRYVIACYWLICAQRNVRYAYHVGKWRGGAAETHYFTMLEDIEVDCGELLRTVALCTSLPTVRSPMATRRRTHGSQM